MQSHGIIHLHLILNPSLVPQLDELLDSLVKWDDLATLLRSLVVAVSPVDSAVLLLFSTNDHDEVVESQLCGTDLLLHSISADVDVGVDVLFAERSLDLLDVVISAGHDGDDHNLARRQPEWPTSGKVLSENAEIC